MSTLDKVFEGVRQNCRYKESVWDTQTVEEVFTAILDAVHEKGEVKLQ